MTTEVEDPGAWMDRVRLAHRAAAAKSDDKRADAFEVAQELKARGWLSPLDSTLDVRDALQTLAGDGLLSGPSR